MTTQPTGHAGYAAKYGVSNIGAVVIGNILEWSDFATYGYFAPVIGRRFFPDLGAVSGLNSAFAVFALGFVGRVVGGYLFARQSARAGQRAALRTSIIIMAISTALIGCLPTFSQVGIIAPLLLVALRVIQGMSLGGEFTTSLTYLYTVSPPGKRGLMCGLIASAATSGFLWGSAFCATLMTWLSPDSVDLYGWRIPFLLGASVAVIAFFLRGRLNAANDHDGYISTHTARSHTTSAASIGVRTVTGCACYMFGFYLIFIYLPSGLHLHSGMGIGSALSLTSASLLLLTVICPLAGMLADRFRPIPVLLVSTIALSIAAIPIFHTLANSTTTAVSIASLTLLTVLFAPIQAVAPLPFIEHALRSGRGASFSIGLNVAGVGFGGLAPIAANLISARYSGLGACGWLLAITAVVSATSLVVDQRQLPANNLQTLQ